MEAVKPQPTTESLQPCWWLCEALTTSKNVFLLTIHYQADNVVGAQWQRAFLTNRQYFLFSGHWGILTLSTTGQGSCPAVSQLGFTPAVFTDSLSDSLDTLYYMHLLDANVQSDFIITMCTIFQCLAQGHVSAWTKGALRSNHQPSELLRYNVHVYVPLI